MAMIDHRPIARLIKEAAEQADAGAETFEVSFIEQQMLKHTPLTREHAQAFDDDRRYICGLRIVAKTTKMMRKRR